MENIRAFFDEIHDYVNDCIKNNIDISRLEIEPYPSLGNFDWNKMLGYRDKIANKLFSMNETARMAYAILLIDEIDLQIVNTEDFLCNKEVSIEGVLYKKSHDDFGYRWVPKEQAIKEGINGKSETHKYKLCCPSLTGEEYYDVTCILSDCRLFLDLIWSVFSAFNIDLKEIAKSQTGLNYDYSFLGQGYSNRRQDYCNSQKSYRTEFTAARQVLAMKIILSELGVDVLNTSKTAITTFLQFITGRQTMLLPQNTNIYKLINRNPHKEGEIKSYNQDCDFIASYFDKLGLNRLANKIKNSKEKL